MALTSRIVYGYAYTANNALAVGATVVVTPSTGVFQSAGSVVVSPVITLTTNASGRYETALVCPARYRITHPGREEFLITVPTGTADVSVESLRGSSGAVLTNPVQTAIDASVAAEAVLRTAADALLQPTSTIAETIDDRVAALLIAGTNITLTYNDAAGTLTIAAAGSASALTWVDIASGALGTGYIYYGAGFGNPGYSIVGNGMVKLRGAIFRSSGTSIDLLSTPLPAGARPSVIRYMSKEGGGTIRVNLDGTLQLWVGSAVPCIFDGIEYSL